VAVPRKVSLVSYPSLSLIKRNITFHEAKNNKNSQHTLTEAFVNRTLNTTRGKGGGGWMILRGGRGGGQMILQYS
jgi:hypothetical protein